MGHEAHASGGEPARRLGRWSQPFSRSVCRVDSGHCRLQLGLLHPRGTPTPPPGGAAVKMLVSRGFGALAGAEPSHLLQPEVKDVTIIFPLAWPVVRKMSPKYVTAEGISVAHTSHQILQTGSRSPPARGPLSECGHVDSFIRKSGVQRRCESGPRRPAVQRAFLFQGGRDASV